jgi:hypothetical protein
VCVALVVSQLYMDCAAQLCAAKDELRAAIESGPEPEPEPEPEPVAASPAAPAADASVPAAAVPVDAVSDAPSSTTAPADDDAESAGYGSDPDMAPEPSEVSDLGEAAAAASAAAGAGDGSGAAAGAASGDGAAADGAAAGAGDGAAAAAGAGAGAGAGSADEDESMPAVGAAATAGVAESGGEVFGPTNMLWRASGCLNVACCVLPGTVRSRGSITAVTLRLSPLRQASGALAIAVYRMNGGRGRLQGCYRIHANFSIVGVPQTLTFERNQINVAEGDMVGVVALRGDVGLDVEPSGGGCRAYTAAKLTRAQLKVGSPDLVFSRDSKVRCCTRVDFARFSFPHSLQMSILCLAAVCRWFCCLRSFASVSPLSSLP